MWKRHEINEYVTTMIKYEAKIQKVQNTGAMINKSSSVNFNF